MTVYSEPWAGKTAWDTGSDEFALTVASNVATLAGGAGRAVFWEQVMRQTDHYAKIPVRAASMAAGDYAGVLVGVSTASKNNTDYDGHLFYCSGDGSDAAIVRSEAGSWTATSSSFTVSGTGSDWSQELRKYVNGAGVPVLDAVKDGSVVFSWTDTGAPAGHLTGLYTGFRAYQTIEIGAPVTAGDLTDRPSFVSKADSGNSAGSTNVLVNKPAGLANGDTWLVVFAGAGADLGAPPAGGGFTEVLDYVCTGADFGIHAYYKYITDAAGEPASYNFTQANAEKSASVSLCIVNADPTTPVAVVGTPAEGSGTTATASAITPGVTNCLLVQITASDGTHTHTTSVMRERSDVTSGGTGADGTKVSMMVATEPLVASTTTGTRAATLDSTDDWVSVLLAIQPTQVAGYVAPKILVPRAASHRASRW